MYTQSCLEDINDKLIKLSNTLWDAHLELCIFIEKHFEEGGVMLSQDKKSCLRKTELVYANRCIEKAIEVIKPRDVKILENYTWEKSSWPAQHNKLGQCVLRYQTVKNTLDGENNEI